MADYGADKEFITDEWKRGKFTKTQAKVENVMEVTDCSEDRFDRLLNNIKTLVKNSAADWGTVKLHNDDGSVTVIGWAKTEEDLPQNI